MSLSLSHVIASDVTPSSNELSHHYQSSWKMAHAQQGSSLPSGQPPLHLIFPPPIPEPPRVIKPNSNFPDISFTSDCPSSNVQSGKKTPITTTIYPADRVLRQLRRKYGIVNSDDDDDYESSEDSNSNSIESNSTKHKNNEDGLRKFNRARLERVQSDIRNQLKRLELNDVNSSSDQHKSNQLTRVPESTQILIDQIRRQERQLERISQQIDVLMKLHRNSRQSENLEDLPTPEDYFEVHIENTKSRAMFEHSLRSKISTSSPKKTNCSKPPKNPDYLDTSIEKLRGELRRNISLAECESQTFPKQLNHSGSITSNSSNSKSSSIEDPKQYYSVMLENINSILERNRSSDSDSRNSTSTPTSYSSRSNASSNSPQCGSDLKMMTKTTTTTTIEQTPTRVRRMLHSEQSLYIQKLASKYHIEEGVEKLEQSVRKPRKAFRKPLDLSPKLPKYALSEHNTSIATRNYLDKYGLTMDGGLYRKCSQILEENEEALEDANDLYLDAQDKTPQKEVRVREIKSRTAPNGQTLNSKIIDLEALRRLPKFT